MEEEEELVVEIVEYVTYALIASTGDIISIGVCLAEDVASQAETGETVVLNPPANITDESHYYKNGLFKAYPTQPSQWHTFNYTTETWVDSKPTDVNAEFDVADYTIEPSITVSGNTLSIAAFTATRENGSNIESKIHSAATITFANKPVLVAYNWDNNTITTYNDFTSLNSAPRRFLIGEFKATGVFVPASLLVDGGSVATNTVGTQQLAPSAVTSTELALVAVGTDHVQNDSINVFRHTTPESHPHFDRSYCEVKFNSAVGAKGLAILRFRIANNAKISIYTPTDAKFGASLDYDFTLPWNGQNTSNNIITRYHYGGTVSKTNTTTNVVIWEHISGVTHTIDANKNYTSTYPGGMTSTTVIDQSTQVRTCTYNNGDIQIIQPNFNYVITHSNGNSTVFSVSDFNRVMSEPQVTQSNGDKTQIIRTTRPNGTWITNMITKKPGGGTLTQTLSSGTGDTILIMLPGEPAIYSYSGYSFGTTHLEIVPFDCIDGENHFAIGMESSTSNIPSRFEDLIIFEAKK